MIALWLWGQTSPLVAPSTDELEDLLASHLGLETGDERPDLREKLGQELERLASLAEVPLIFPPEASNDGQVFLYALHLSPFALAMTEAGDEL